MSTSKGPAIIDKLAIEVPAVVDVQFSEAWPGAGIQKNTFMAMDYESTIGYETSAMTSMGPANYTEDGKLTCYLLIDLPGKEAVDVRVRAFEIADDFTAWVRSDITLGGVLCGGPAWVSGIQWIPGMGDNSRDGALRIDLSWHDNDV